MGDLQIYGMTNLALGEYGADLRTGVPSARYFRIKGTNRSGAMILVVAVPSSCFDNTISS